MNTRVFHRVLAVVVLAMLSGSLPAQVGISAAPPPLSAVKTIYIASPSDDFVNLLRFRIERWGAVRITAQPGEADAILTCETAARTVPAKVVLWRMDARVRLVDRLSQRLIWSTEKSTTWDTSALADEVFKQLQYDRERAAALR